MKIIQYILIIITICFFCGCSLLSTKKNVPPDPSKYVQTGKILNEKRLKEGKKLLIIPFKAGENIEATSELDKIALMLVKGIAEILNKNDSGLEILTAENADTADLIIKGYITDLGMSSKIKRFFMRKSKIVLGIEGKMLDRETEEVLVYFKDNRVYSGKDINHRQLGYLVGEDIGRFLMTGLK